MLKELFLAKNNTYYREDKFFQNECRFLFITGCSGSGKTTLSNKLGTGLGVPAIHLDELWRVSENIEYSSYNEYINRFIAYSSFPPISYKLATPKETFGRKYADFEEVLYQFVNYLETQYSGRFILEGTYIALSLYFKNSLQKDQDHLFKKIKDQSIIVLRTPSIFVSGIRALKRNIKRFSEEDPDFDKRRYAIKFPIKRFPTIVPMYNACEFVEKEVKHFPKDP